jgi:hypothetical protein
VKPAFVGGENARPRTNCAAHRDCLAPSQYSGTEHRGAVGA